MRGQFPNHVWAIDVQFDETADVRPVKILNVTDEFTREALATNAARRITALGTSEVLDKIVDERGQGPVFLRMDTGPEFIADFLKNLCRTIDIDASSVDPGSPWQNGRIESFNSASETSWSPKRSSTRSGRGEPCSKSTARTTTTTGHSVLAYLTPVELVATWQADRGSLTSQQVGR